MRRPTRPWAGHAPVRGAHVAPQGPSFGGSLAITVGSVTSLGERRVELLGITDRVDEGFARQAARNLIDDGSAAMKCVTHLIIDRDGKFTPTFQGAVKHADIKVIRTPTRSPNCNAFAERFVRTLKDSVLDRMIFFGEASLRRAVGEFVNQHYANERNHQGIGNKIPAPGPEVGRKSGVIRRATGSAAC